ncbi:MAG: hypothetical protein JWO86_5939, partial [Myxococcaceae bacterium]|nr:hypothetical protein [Myxococcaceae bacterium]
MRMHRSHRVMAALALASGALAACNMLTGLDAEYSSSAHDGAVAPIGEGGGPDSPGSDGGMEGAANDGMVKPDGDAGFTTWCQAKQNGVADGDFLCTDFETESFPDGGSAPTPWFSLTNNLDAGAFSFVPDAGDGGSRVLDVVGVSTAAGGAHSFLKAALAFTPTPANKYQQYVFEFEFRVLASNLDYEALGLLVFKPNDATGENGIAGYGPGTPHYLSHQGGTPLLTKIPNNAPLAWHLGQVTLTRVDGGPTYTRTIKIDDIPVDDTVGTHTIDVGAPTELGMGIFNADNTPGTAHAQFDNVVLRRT